MTRTAVELLDVDAAVLRMPDARGGPARPASGARSRPASRCRPRPDPERPQALEKLSPGEPIALTAQAAERLGGGHGSSALSSSAAPPRRCSPLWGIGEIMAALTLVSLDPERRIDGETLEAARSLTAQAALAIDNARLYQQQMHFADAMQRARFCRRASGHPGHRDRQRVRVLRPPGRRRRRLRLHSAP